VTHLENSKHRVYPNDMESHKETRKEKQDLVTPLGLCMDGEALIVCVRVYLLDIRTIAQLVGLLKGWLERSIQLVARHGRYGDEAIEAMAQQPEFHRTP
jgi:hypothetical protein